MRASRISSQRRDGVINSVGSNTNDFADRTGGLSIDSPDDLLVPAENVFNTVSTSSKRDVVRSLSNSTSSGPGPTSAIASARVKSSAKEASSDRVLVTKPVSNEHQLVCVAFACCALELRRRDIRECGSSKNFRHIALSTVGSSKRHTWKAKP